VLDVFKCLVEQDVMQNAAASDNIRDECHMELCFLVEFSEGLFEQGKCIFDNCELPLCHPKLTVFFFSNLRDLGFKYRQKTLKRV